MTEKWLVGIPTYRRPEMLMATLESLKEQRGAPPFIVCITDNDPDESAKITVGRYRPELKITYIHEPRPGVVHVRNQILRYAASFDYLAFLDDDEVVGDTWLSEMRRATEYFPGAVIKGPVKYLLNQDSEQSPLHSVSFAERHHPRGAILATTGTGNSVLPMAAIRKKAPTLMFDSKFSTTGGEDTKFFRQLSRVGVTIRWWPEAIAHETVPLGRSTKQATADRVYRAGYVNAMLRLEYQSRSVAMIGAVLRVVAGFVVMTLGVGRLRRAKGYARFMTGRGAVSAVLGRELRYYGGSNVINGE